MEPGVLEGVRILDMAEGLAGSVAALLLAEAGADVVKVQPPRPGVAYHATGARTWDRSKRSIVLDLEAPEDVDRLHALLDAADVLVHELTPSRAEALGVDDAAIARQHPQVVVSSVLSWPANHPDADRPVDELLAMARLGVCDEQKAMRRSGPVFVRFPLGGWGAAYLAAAGIVARLLVRLRTGTAGPAHTSLVQGALAPMGMHWSRAERPSPALAMGMPKESGGSQASLFECGDGVWIHLMKAPDDSPLMQQALAEMGPEPVAAANAEDGGSPFGFANRGANTVAFRTRPSTAWLEDFWAHDIPVQPAAPFGAVLADEQARVNGYVLDLDDPEEGPITVGGLPLTIDPPARVTAPAPRRGAHTAEVLAEWQPRAVQAGDAPLPRWPLEGVKVLDLGNFLAGPYAAVLLADLGADVIKVESTEGDSMRPVGWAFAGCQRGKRGVALDLKAEGARPVLEALVRWADVVHHNVRLPAARRLGIDAETLREVNPRLVHCHTSSYGPAGPRADWPGYDQLFQAQCGWEVLGAGEGNPPMWHRFGFMDHQCALASVVATVLALYRRERTGEGSAVAASLLGAGALTASETHLRADGSLAPFAVVDPEQTGTAPGYGIVRCLDGWIAVAARSAEELAALRGVAGSEDVTAAMADRGSDEVLTELERAGVPAEPVREQQCPAFFDDEGNRRAGLVASYEQAEWGRLEQPGALWYLGDLEVRLDRPPPALGEHTVEVLAELGFERPAIDALLEAGVVAARPS